MEKQYFFDKYKIEDKDFKKTKLAWTDLLNIYNDYLKYLPRLESTAIFIFNNLMKIPGVHSVRYRVGLLWHENQLVKEKFHNPAQTPATRLYN